MGREHRLGAADIHHDWDRSREPALTIRPGDVVHIDLPITGEGQVAETSTIDEVVWDFDTIYNLAGPVFVAGGEPGDTLEVEVLDLTPGPCGVDGLQFPASVSSPTITLIRSSRSSTYGMDPPRPSRRVCRGPARSLPRDDGRYHGRAGAAFALPSPRRRRQRRLSPSRRRLDTLAAHLMRRGTLLVRRLARGTGGRRGVRQRDRMCDAGHTQVRTSQAVDRRSRIQCPTRRGRLGSALRDNGIDADLMEGARRAVRNMIGWLVAEHGLSREDAYILCSLEGDLRIHEIVDAGVWNVGMVLPLSVFDEAGSKRTTAPA